MKEIQNAIAVAVQTCIRQLKNSTKLIDWNDEELSVENCVTKNFDMTLSRQLQKDWHRLKPETKRLIEDLRSLRTLFQYLINDDCIQFWKLINNIKTTSASSRYPSMWLLTPAADMLFRKSKDRLYKILKEEKSEKSTDPSFRLQPVLEESPKWRLLKHILKEIYDDYSKKTKCIGPVNVLIMAKDVRTVVALKRYLVEGKEKAMTHTWLNYLQGYNDRSRSVTKNSGGMTGITEESRLLLEEESRARQLIYGRRKRVKGGGKRKALNHVPDYVRKNRRIAREKSRGKETSHEDDLERRAVLDEAVQETEREPDGILPISCEGDSGNDDTDESHWFNIQQRSELRLILKSYSSIEGNQAGLLLSDLDPKYVVLYDAEISFVRAIEIHSSLQDKSQELIRVFFMLFQASAEEKSFKLALEREKNAFEKLIHHKRTMPVPLNTLAATTQEMQLALDNVNGLSGTYANGTLPLAVDTRTRQGKSTQNTEKREIAVDVREFRSALPSILHQGGMRLAPVTLTVGDFVLSKVHCIERKSLSDLFGSFASGRLYSQAESMSKYYECPCLLIEFDPSKAFCLVNENDIGIEIRNDSVTSKMVLLTTHFPKLRILWSRSPYETLRVFKTLKQNHEEVDVDKAVDIGQNESVEALLSEVSDDDEINETARDMLLRLPGVSVHNARKIMRECDSIADLAQMSREELKRVAGPMVGQKLFTFFRQKFGAT